MYLLLTFWGQNSTGHGRVGGGPIFQRFLQRGDGVEDFQIVALDFPEQNFTIVHTVTRFGFGFL